MSNAGLHPEDLDTAERTGSSITGNFCPAVMVEPIVRHRRAHDRVPDTFYRVFGATAQGTEKSYEHTNGLERGLRKYWLRSTKEDHSSKSIDEEVMKLQRKEILSHAGSMLSEFSTVGDASGQHTGFFDTLNQKNMEELHEYWDTKLSKKCAE